MACVNKLKQAHTCNHYILHLLLMTDTSTPKLLHTSSRIYQGQTACHVGTAIPVAVSLPPV